MQYDGNMQFMAHKIAKCYFNIFIISYFVVFVKRFYVNFRELKIAIKSVTFGINVLSVY